MTAKEAFKKPGVLLFLGVLIGAALVWISSALTTSNWNLYAITPPAVPGGGSGGGGNATTNSGRMASSPITSNEKSILDQLTAKLSSIENSNIPNNSKINQANDAVAQASSQLGNIRSDLQLSLGTPTTRPHCESCECWSWNGILINLQACGRRCCPKTTT